MTIKLYSVLRMLCNFVGQDIFLKGVSIYLKDHLYGNTTTKDLWNGINRATFDRVTIDVPKMMENWIMKVQYMSTNLVPLFATHREVGFCRLDFRCSLSLKRMMESEYVKTATLKPVLPKRRTIKQLGVSLVSPPRLALFTDPHRTIPLAVLTVDDTGRPSIDKTAVLTARETTLVLDTNKPYKLNAGTYGVCAY